MECFRKQFRKIMPAHNSQSIRMENTGTVETRTHDDCVNCITDAASTYCLTGSNDRIVALTDYLKKSVIKKWVGHNRDITKVAYGKLKNIMLSGSRDKTINLWQVNHDYPIQSLIGHQLVITGLGINPTDNQTICSGSRDNSFKLWDIDTGQCITSSTLSRNLVTHLKWSPNGNFIASTSEDKEVKILDPHNLQIIHSFPKKMQIQTYCDVDQSEKYCLSCSNGFNETGSEATLWDLNQRQILHEYHGHYDGVTTCAFLEISGKAYVVTGSQDGTLRLWERDFPKCVQVLPLEGVGTMTGLAIPTPDTILLSTYKRGIQVIKVTDVNGLHMRKMGEF